MNKAPTIEDTIQECTKKLSNVNAALLAGVNEIKIASDKFSRFNKIARFTQQHEIYTNREMETIKQKRAQTITPKLPGLVIVCNERLEELLELSKIYMQEIDFYLDVQAGDIDVEDLKKNKAKVIERAEKLSSIKFKKEIANNEKKREYERMRYWVENLEKGGVVNKEILREMLIFKSKKDYLEIENKRKANKEALLKTEVKVHELERKKERYDLLVQRIDNTKWETNDSDIQCVREVLKQIFVSFQQNTYIIEDRNGLKGLLKALEAELIKMKDIITNQLQEKLILEFKKYSPGLLEKFLLFFPKSIATLMSEIVDYLYTAPDRERLVSSMVEKFKDNQDFAANGEEVLSILFKLELVVANSAGFIQTDPNWGISDLLNPEYTIYLALNL